MCIITLACAIAVVAREVALLFRGARQEAERNRVFYDWMDGR